MDYVFVFLVATSSISASAGFQWTSSVDLPAGVTVQACSGETVVLPWKYRTEDADHVIDVEWLFEGKGHTQDLIASSVRGHFTVTATATQDVRHVPEAGIQLVNVTVEDSGVYTVNVVVNLHGAIVVQSQHARLVVAAPPVSSDGQLHITMSPEAVYDNRTQQWSVQLKCGPLSSPGHPAVAVTWTTPTNETILSTSFHNGNFLLNLPVPVSTGDYSCQLEHNSSAMCIHSDSPLLAGNPSVTVEGVQAQLAIFSARLGALQMENHDFRSELEELKINSTRENQALRSELERHENQSEKEMQSLRSELEQERAEIKRQGLELEQLKSEIEQQRTASQELKERFDNLTFSLQFVLLRPENCLHVQQYVPSSGVHELHVHDVSFAVYCDQSTDGGGWTVIQKRLDGSVDFYRNWTSYEDGFGDLSGEYWLGLTYIHLLTSRGHWSLRVDLQDFNGTSAYAIYDRFSVSGPEDNYTLTIGGYSGTAGDSMTQTGGVDLNHTQFTTYDRDNDNNNGNCAERDHGAWWANSCFNSDLNGRYYNYGQRPDDAEDGITWFNWHYDFRTYKGSQMKIKPRI